MPGTLVTLLLLVLTACDGLSDGSGATTTLNEPSPTSPVESADPGLAIVPAGGAKLYEDEGGGVLQTAVEGLMLPITSVSGTWYQVMTSCGADAWVRSNEVDVVHQNEPKTPGPGFDVAQAVIVVDPGHGGRDLGAKGSTGTWESHVNLDIATRIRDRLESPNSIDWESGTVIPGTDYPAFGRVWSTRAVDGPLQGDIELGLAYRAELANGVGADALLAVHNNTSPARSSDTPGSDVFYSVNSPGSDRLASLIHEELVTGFARIGSEFSRARIAGVKTRVLAETEDDYYGLLRRTTAPGVIIEGLYISEGPEEAILTSDVGQQAYADAVYRGLIRFLTTNETGSPIHDPIPFDGDVGTVTNTNCEVPTQP